MQLSPAQKKAMATAGLIFILTVIKILLGLNLGVAGL